MTVYYLEMHAAKEVVPPAICREMHLRKVVPAEGAVNQRYYREVGQPWNWTDRAAWTVGQWQVYVETEGLHTYLIEHAGEEIGYAEMHDRGGDVELVYFGLLPPQVGRGLGSPALVAVLGRAWAFPKTRRVWLHTCEGDHPNALRNYERRGFRLYKTVWEES